MTGKRIKPKVEEISLAYNPANRKKFFMFKEEDMDNIIKALQDEAPLLKEEAVDSALKSLSVNENGQKAVKASLKILNMFKDDIPKSVISSLASTVPEYAIFVSPSMTDEEIDKLKKDIQEQTKKETEDAMKKEGSGNEVITVLTAKVEALEKDLIAEKDKTQKAVDTQRSAEIHQSLKEMHVPGDLEVLSKDLVNVEKDSPASFASIMKTYKDCGTMLDAAGVLSEIGVVGNETGTSAFAQLDTLAKEKLEKDTSTTPAKAWKDVIRDNPDLYKRYTVERGGK